VEVEDLEEARSIPKVISAGDVVRVGPHEITMSRELARGGPKDIEIRFLPRYQVHRLLEKRLIIARQQGGSRLVEISYEDPDRVLAAQVVSRVVTEYVNYSVRTEVTQDTTTVARLRREVDSTARKLAASE